MNYLFPPSVPAVPIAGRDVLFPVQRIWCVGRNYADHAREVGADPEREPPFFFAKPAQAIVPGGGAVPYPPGTENLQHEIELVVAISKGGANIAVADAPSHVFGYAVGLDLTRRDLQAAAKQKGHPWEMGKGFDHSAPISAIVDARSIGHPNRGAIRLAVNGTKRQSGDLSEMIWSVPEVIAELSRLVALAAGDLLFTGTPAGVGRLVPGDRVSGSIEHIGALEVEIVGADAPRARK